MIPQLACKERLRLHLLQLPGSFQTSHSFHHLLCMQLWIVQHKGRPFVFPLSGTPSWHEDYSLTTLHLLEEGREGCCASEARPQSLGA